MIVREAKRDRPLRVHLWVQDLVRGRGGIQTYSKHLLEALHWALGTENIRVLSKNDVPAVNASHGSPTNACGSWPPKLRTVAFASRMLWDGLTLRPDLIIMTHLNFSPIGLWLTKLRRIPYYCVAHGVEAWDLKRRDCVRGLRAASRVLAASSYTRQRLLAELHLTEDRVRVLPNTFRPDTFRPGPKSELLLQRHAINSSKKIILTVGRLAEPEKYKGYDKIIRAMPRILNAIPKAHYVLVGDGQDRKRIKHLVGSLRLNHSVTLAGAVTDAELPSYYNLCDVFAMPSKGEGFGIVYLEALSCGKPVLAGNVDGSRDPLQNGQLGVLVNPDNPEEIAEALISILNRTYPLPILYQADDLRERTIRAFGPDRFFCEVKRQLDDFRQEEFRRRVPARTPVAGCTRMRG